jgi:hypothetical protein
MDERSWLTRISGGSRWVLLRRLAAASGTLLFLVIVLGCMSLQFGGGASTTEVVHTDDTAYAQTGKVHVPPGKEIEVYYPVSYVSSPNLELDSTFDDCLIVEQKADHFLVKNTGSFSREAKWKARGTKGSPPAVVAGPASTQAPPAAMPAVPAQPLPPGSTPSTGSSPQPAPVTPLARQ